MISDLSMLKSVNRLTRSSSLFHSYDAHKERNAKKMLAQFRLGGGSFNRKASPANCVFVVDFCCSINSHEYNGAVQSIKVLKVVRIIILYTILSLIFNQCRSIRTSVIWSRRGVLVKIRAVWYLSNQCF